jgi:hypothetical protein
MQLTEKQRYGVRQGDNGRFWVIDYTIAKEGGIASPIYATRAEAEAERERLITAKPNIDGGTF